MSTPTLSGPSAAAASGGKAKQLVVFLHGVGADGNDLIGLAPYFAQALPDADFVSPNAPFAYDMAPFGFQWFSLADRSPAAIGQGIRATAPILNAFIDAELAKRGLSDDKLILVGFSQGTMMALHVALRRDAACAAVIGFSGMLAVPDSLAAEITSRPQVLLVHGDADEVVSPDYLPISVQMLESVGVPVLSHVCPGLGHGIDDQGLVLAVRFAGQVAE